MAPDEGLSLFTELGKARQCFVLETELHLIYLVTPYSACYSWGNIDWMFYLDLWEKLPLPMKRVAELVGVKESYIVNGTRGKIQTNTNKLYQKLLIHKRFFVALALQDLVNEKPLGWVCSKFNCNRGMLQSLQQSASSFAGMVTSFSRQLGWSSVELLISQFQDRLQFGISRDLLDLMRLPILNGKMARTLFNGGIETVAHLANSAISKIENILHREIPFASERERDGESEFEMKQRNKFRNVWITGKEGLTEGKAAEMLVTEAREYLKLEMGLAEAKWETSLRGSEQIMDKIYKDAKQLQKGGGNISMPRPNKIPNDEEIPKSTDNFTICNDSGVLNSVDNTDISNTSSKNVSSDSRKIEDIDLENSQSPNYDTRRNTSYKSSIFNSIDHFTQSPKKNLKTPQKNEVSKMLMSPSSVEINISGSSVVSSRSNLNVSVEKVQSDESLFDESFSLKLSDSDKDSSKNSEEQTQLFAGAKKKLTGAFTSTTFLENAFSGTFNEGKDLSNNSEDMFSTSVSEETPDGSKRRRLRSSEIEQKKPNKKQKTETFNDNVEESDINLSYYANKLHNDDEQVDFNKFEIVDVCAESILFELFIKEVRKQKTFALSLACTKLEEENMQGIGVKRNDEENVDETADFFSGNNRRLNGFSISWGGNVTFYLSLNNTNYQNKIINLIKMLITNHNIRVKMFDSKEQIKVLKNCTGISFYAELDDPKVADWILDPEGKEKNLLAMVSIILYYLKSFLNERSHFCSLTSSH